MNSNLPPRHDIPSYWRPHRDDAVFLHLGENPFPPTERVCRAIAEAGQCANRYPDTNFRALREKIAEYAMHGVSPDNILCGNGSDELIDLAVVSFSRPDRPVAVFSPTFFVYGFAAQRHSIPVVSIPRAEDYTLPEYDSLPSDIVQGDYSVTFIANPNNPTGTQTPRERLEEYLHRWPGTIVVDECYYEFSGETVIDLIHERDNLIVFRSLSKSFGLSGLRLGYAVAARNVIDTMERHSMTFPVNVCAQAAGIAALEDVEEYQRRIRELIQRRDRLKQTLEGLGLETIPSRANFILTLWPQTWMSRQPARLLAEQGILVSDQTAAMNLGRPALRIAVSTEMENERLLQTVRSLTVQNGIC